LTDQIFVSFGDGKQADVLSHHAPLDFIFCHKLQDEIEIWEDD